MSISTPSPRAGAHSLLSPHDAGTADEEAAFLRFSDEVPTMIWLADGGRSRVHFNRGWLTFTGRRIEEERGLGWMEGVHPDDRERCTQEQERAVAEGVAFRSEYRLRCHDGSYRWVQDHGEPRGDASAGYVGSCFDVTDRKEAEERLVSANASLGRTVEQRTAELRSLSQYLLRSTEEEKARLARELHDELGSTLTAVNIDLGVLKGKLKHASPEFVPGLEQTMAILGGATRLMRRMMEDLRPSILDAMGLATAIESLCAEFTRRTGVPCRRTLPDRMDRLDQYMSIALYRIAQEALANIARVAKPAEVELVLERTPEEIRLIIRDDGEAYAPEAIVASLAHGVSGMRERVANLGGRFDIRAGDDNRGTVVEVSIPAALGADDGFGALPTMLG